MTFAKLLTQEVFVAFKRKRFFSGDFYPLKKIHKEGIVGFQENFINPYVYGTSRFKEWERGYNKGYFINLKRINRNAV